MITILTDENKVTYRNGVMYMRIGNTFTDSINVYDGKDIEVKLGVINFVKKGKTLLNKTRGDVRYVDGFVFELEPQVNIQCTIFKQIARYVYDLNEQFKEYGRMKGQDNNDRTK